MNNGNQNQRQFTEVGSNTSNNARWEPTKMQFSRGQEPFLDGYFKSLTELQGPNGMFNVACIVTVNPDGSLGEEVDVSGGMTLENKLREIPLGSFIRIVYEGKAKSKTPGRTYNVFKTYVDANAIPYSQLGGVSAPAVQKPVQQMQQQSFNNNAPQNVQQQGQPFANPFAGQQQPINNGMPVQQQASFQKPIVPPANAQQWVPPASNPQNGFNQANANQNPFGNSAADQNDDLPF